MFSKLKLILRKSFVGKWYFLRTRKKSKGKSAKPSLKDKFSFISKIRFFKKRFIFAFILLLFFSFIILNIRIYFSIRPIPAFSNDSPVSTVYDKNEVNTLFIGITNVDGYSYIDLVQLMSIDISDQKVNLYAISPYTESIKYKKLNSTIQLRSIFNNNTEDPSLKIADLNKNIESITSLRVDRYVLFETSELLTDARNTGIIPGVSDMEKLREYYFTAKDISISELNKRQSELISQYINAHSSSIKRYFRLFLNSNDFTAIFRTDMNREELVGFVSNFKFIKKNIKIINLNKDELIIKDLVTPLKINSEFIYETIRESEKESLIIAEQAGIEIYNDTEIPGLAALMARRLEVKGANILRPANYVMDDVDENVLFVFGELDLYSNTINLIRRELRGDVIIKEDGYKFNHTGDLILILAK